MQTRNINNLLLIHHAEIKTYVDENSTKVILKKISIGEKNVEINLVGTGKNEHDALIALEKTVLNYQTLLNQMENINSFPELVLVQYTLNLAITKIEKEEVVRIKRPYNPTKRTIW